MLFTLKASSGKLVSSASCKVPLLLFLLFSWSVLAGASAYAVILLTKFVFGYLELQFHSLCDLEGK